MRVAVVLFNLGGPDTQAAVKPFLQNLFSDPAIIRAPAFIRWFLARFIAGRRAPVARQIYAKMGGGSPILANTQKQATALEAVLGEGFKCFIAMRYWHPRAAEVVSELKAYQPDKIICLPLYPQFSSTTTQSSLDEFLTELSRVCGAAFTEKLVPDICCYPADDGFIEAQVQLIHPLLAEAARHGQPRLLLSAHGLPEKVIKAGDPYQWQCEQTAKAIVQKLNQPALDWVNCYQSRVGPLKWIGPSTEEEVRRAGRDKVPVVVVPMVFVSEHSETLVELDLEYRELASIAGVPYYGRVPTVDAHPAFIAGLAARVRLHLTDGAPTRICLSEFSNCPCRA